LVKFVETPKVFFDFVNKSQKRFRIIRYLRTFLSLLEKPKKATG